MTRLESLNAITAGLGGEGNATDELTAWQNVQTQMNAIVAVLNGISGGTETTYQSALSALVIGQGGTGTGDILTLCNELATIVGATPQLDILSALNAIITELGGNTKTNILDAYTEIGMLLSEPPAEAALVFEFSEGNAPESMASNLAFAEGYSFEDLTETKVGDTITLTGEALGQITEINVPNQANMVSISGLEYCTSLSSLYCDNCTSLTTLPTLPDSLTSLACSGCTSLTTLPTLPDLLTSLVCSGCTSLTTLPTLPDLLTSLVCYSLISLTTLPTIPASLTSLACSGCTSLTTLPTIPASLKFIDCYNCNLTTNAMDAAVNQLDNNGQENGFFVWNPQDNLAEPNQSAQSYLNLIAKGWSFVSD